MTLIDHAIARKVLEVVDAGLVSGIGDPVPGRMCVEAAVCYALGLPHGDEPDCVAPALRRLKIRLNDSTWSSNDARAKGLRRLALAQLGSAGVLDEAEFVRRVGKLAMTTSAPKAIRAAASLFRDGTATKERLLNAAVLCESGNATRENTKEFRDWAWQIRWGSSAADADAAAVAVAVADAVADAAAVAVADAAKQKFWDAYWKRRNEGSEQRDAALAEFCEGVVQILIEMKAPGCQWLSLTEAA